MQFTFLGKAAHVADATYHGVNALDASSISMAA